MGYRLGVGAGTAIYKRPVGQEDEDVGLLVSGRLRDFSDSFKKLSKTLMRDTSLRHNYPRMK